ncbi:MAG: drug/metabolite exporter YedA [Gemmatimonadaceae bacterium]|nr:drug/metabolite exporter YedA [Gemmatimonadaceae bacterium]
MTPGAAPRATRAQLVIGFLILYVVWGSTYLAIRWGVATIPPFVMGATRFLLAGASLYGYQRWRGAAAPTRVEWRNAAVVGAMLLFIGNGAVSWASKRVDSGIASLLVSTVPLWLVLCEVVQGQRPSLLKWAGVALGLVGVGLLVLPLNGDWSQAAIDPIGALVLTLGSLSWTVGSLFSRTAQMAKPASMAIAMQMLVGGSLLLLLSLATGEWQRVDPAAITMTSVYSLLYLIVFGSLIGFSTYMWLLSVASPTAGGTYAYVNPVVAVLLGVLLAGERLPSQAVLAMCVIVGGVAMVSLGGHRIFAGKRP